MPSFRRTPIAASTSLAVRSGPASAPGAAPLAPSIPGAARRGGSAGLALGLRGRRNPRVVAALAYALPLVPAVVLLQRERRNRFVRVHAATALVFFASLALAQVALYVLLVVAGSRATDPRAATLFGIGLLAGWALVGVLGLALWLRLMASAMEGRVAHLPLLSGLARAIESAQRRISDAMWRPRNRSV